MNSKLLTTALATCLMMVGVTAQPSFAETPAGARLMAPFLMMDRYVTHAAQYGIPSTPPGMVPMTVYVPAQALHALPMAAPVAPPVPPHTHAPMPPQAAQTINATHCSINDVAVLTQDAPSCTKAGGKVVAEKASFAFPFCLPGMSGCS